MKNFFRINQKIKLIIINVLIFNLLILPSFPNFFVQSEDSQTAVDYLEVQTPDPWITMALATAGKTNLDLDYLKTVSGDLATDYEKTILALTAAGQDPRTFGNIDFVTKLKNFYQSNQIGSPDLLNDDFWGILSLTSVGESQSSQIIQDSKDFILKNQNSNGGWSYAISGQSDTNDTAVAIMALLEAGVKPSEPQIIKAIDYLKLSQNNDGGLPYLQGSESDSGSDAWVISAIYRLGQDPKDWQKEGKNPIDHLKSLQRSDGSFKWISSEDKSYSVLTAHALIALNEKFYPISRLHHLRIEGKDNQICDAYIKANTALDIVENGSTACGYTYFIEQSGWGPYLTKINNEKAEDLIGWLFFVNSQISMVGASDYILAPGDEVLWYFGEWGWKPTRLKLSDQQVNPGDSSGVKIEYFEDYWKPLAEATVYTDSGLNFNTDQNGEANLIIDNPGFYRVYAKKSGYIRTNQSALSVGEGASKNVDLKVEIIPPIVPEIGFSISKSQIDFGRLTPGAEINSQLLIQNSGNVPISLKGAVGGNQIFKENITLDGLNGSEFFTIINKGSEKNITVKLKIPNNWTSFGVKEGNLIFWATANQ